MHRAWPTTNTTSTFSMFFRILWQFTSHKTPMWSSHDARNESRPRDLCCVCSLNCEKKNTTKLAANGGGSIFKILQLGLFSGSLFLFLGVLRKFYRVLFGRYLRWLSHVFLNL